MGSVKEALENVTAETKPFVAIPIKKDMHLELYSDGFTDMQTEDGIRYDDDRAKEFFINLYSKNFEEVSDTIKKTVDGWIMNAMLPDDVTVLDIRF